MPISSELHPHQRLVRSRLWGVVSDPDLREHARLLRADPAFDPSHNHLVDLREVTELRVARDTIEAVARVSVFARGVRRAVVASSDFHYGMARMFEIFSDGTGRTVTVFRDVREAEDWLGLSGLPDPSDTVGGIHTTAGLGG